MSNKSAMRRAGRRAITRSDRWLFAVLVCGGKTVIAACGSGSPGAAGAPGARAGLSLDAASGAGQAKVNCTDVDSLRASLESLSHMTVSASSQGALTKELGNVQKQATALKGQGGGRFSGTSNELTASVAQFSKASAEQSSNPAGAQTQATTALNGLKSKTPAILAELNKACPKPAT